MLHGSGGAKTVLSPKAGTVRGKIISKHNPPPPPPLPGSPANGGAKIERKGDEKKAPPIVKEYKFEVCNPRSLLADRNCTRRAEQ